MLQQCANCEGFIGHLDTPLMWGDRVVCRTCYHILSSREISPAVPQLRPMAPAAIVPPTAASVAFAPEEPPEETVAAFDPPSSQVLPPAPSIPLRPATPHSPTPDAVSVETVLCPSVSSLEDLTQAAAAVASVDRAAPARTPIETDPELGRLPWIIAAIVVLGGLVGTIVIWQRVHDSDDAAVAQAAPASVAPETPSAPADNAPSGSVAETVDPQSATLAGSSAVPTPSVNHDTPEAVQSNNQPAGRVVCTVNWESHQTSSKAADSGAVVILLPHELKTRLSIPIAPGSASAMSDDQKKELADTGAHLSIADGDGKATFDGVQPGRYTAVIVSGNTHEDGGANEADLARLGQWFSEPSTQLHKVTQIELEVHPGAGCETSYDFGETDW